MKFKPDESTIMEWLYGELDDDRRKQVDEYFKENPEEWKKVQGLQRTRDLFASLADKEVIPPVIDEKETKVVPFWRQTSFRWVASAAAALVFVMIAARLLDVSVSISSNEVRIAFGSVAENRTPYLTLQQVNQLVAQSEQATKMQCQTQLDQNKNELDETIRKNLQEMSLQLKNVNTSPSNVTKDDIQKFVATLQKEQMTELKTFLQLSASSQQKYTDQLLMDFSRYLQEQRVQDLGMFDARFTRLEKDADELKVETEQILASIISNTNTVPRGSY